MAIGDDRYSRQRVLPEIGEDGQQRLDQATILILGCGALGSVQAQLLARAGVGRLLVLDRDVVEENNLQRQITFDEQDARAALPKAVAVERRLRAINSSIRVEGLVTDVTARNVEKILADPDLVMDGSDNFETRYLLNDACVKMGVPWVYGGVIGTSGMSMLVMPGEGPCLRCVFPDPPPPGSAPTCDTAGVLNAASAMVASAQVAQAMRLLVDPQRPPAWHLTTMDPWEESFRSTEVRRNERCRCCGEGEYDFLLARTLSWTTTLCGRDSVQISPPERMGTSLEQLSQRLEPLGEVSFNGRLLQFRVGAHTLLVFPDGRTIVQGTTDEAVARSLYSKYVGG